MHNFNLLIAEFRKCLIRHQYVFIHFLKHFFFFSVCILNQCYIVNLIQQFVCCKTIDAYFSSENLLHISLTTFKIKRTQRALFHKLDLKINIKYRTCSFLSTRLKKLTKHNIMQHQLNSVFCKSKWPYFSIYGNENKITVKLLCSKLFKLSYYFYRNFGPYC